MFAYVHESGATVITCPSLRCVTVRVGFCVYAMLLLLLLFVRCLHTNPGVHSAATVTDMHHNMFEHLFSPRRVIVSRRWRRHCRAIWISYDYYSFLCQRQIERQAAETHRRRCFRMQSKCAMCQMSVEKARPSLATPSHRVRAVYHEFATLDTAICRGCVGRARVMFRTCTTCTDQHQWNATVSFSKNTMSKMRRSCEHLRASLASSNAYNVVPCWLCGINHTMNIRKYLWYLTLLQIFTF